MNVTRKAVLGSAALLVAGSMTLTGCKANATDNGTASPSTSGSTSATPTAIPTKSTTPLPPNPTFAGTPAGAAGDVSWDKGKCPLEAGKQTVKGTVKNSTKAARDYAIMIIWLKNGSGTPLGAGRVIVQDLAPGAEKEWTITAQVADKADQCVPNVYAGNLK